jgi:hypothetical protein
VLVGYLLVMCIPAWLAWANATSGGRGAIVAHTLASVLSLGVAIRSRSSRGLRKLADWLPLLAVPFLYAELPILIGGVGSPLHDDMAQVWERSIFGDSPAQTLATSWPSPTISALLHLGYLAYYPLIYLPALWMYRRGRRQDFERLVATVTVVFAVCFTAFVVFPVAGPRYLWPPAPAPDGVVRRFALALLAAGSSRGAAFPSSHVAVMAAQSVVLLRTDRRLGVFVTVCAILVGLGAVYGGFHYAVDVLAGAVTGSAIAVLMTTSLARKQPASELQLDPS